MESMSHDPAAGAIGLQLVDMASRGVSSGAAASMSMTALVPAGADEVSAQAAAAFAAEGAAMLALHTAAQEEVARTGVTLTDIARMYSQVDGAAAGTLESVGSQFPPQPFVGGTAADAGTGLMRAETLPGAGGSAARTPLLANLIEGAPAPNPVPTVPGGPATVPPAVPAGVNAAAMALGAGAAPLSSIGSIAQGASAGGAGGPGLASSSLAGNQEEGDDLDGKPPGEQPV
jgi:PE family